MRKLILLAGLLTIAPASTRLAYATPPFDTAYVEPTTGSDSSSCGPATSPCATLNQALANITSGGNVYVLSGGTFGPIYLTTAVSIHGPPDDSFNIVWSSTAPGCVGQAAGTCGQPTAIYAVEIEATSSDVFKFRDLIINNGSGTSGAMRVGNADNVRMSSVSLRGGTGSPPQLLLAIPNTGSQFQLLIEGGDIGYSTGGGVLVEPQGSTSAVVDATHTIVQNLQFGLKFNASETTATAGVEASVNNSEVLNINGSGVAVIGTGSSQARLAVSRSNLLNADAQAVQVNGANALANLYSDTIIGNTIGINLESGGVAKTLGNSDFDNTNDCALNETPTSCSSVLSPQGQL
jgi:hypothetical protein